LETGNRGVSEGKGNPKPLHDSSSEDSRKRKRKTCNLRSVEKADAHLKTDWKEPFPETPNEGTQSGKELHQEEVSHSREAKTAST